MSIIITIAKGPLGLAATDVAGAASQGIRCHMENRAMQEIFVVDDDPAVRESLSLLLTAAGYRVICFAEGNAMLAVARRQAPAAILLDVNIPGKSGLEILRELHDEDFAAPVFIISGYGDIPMAVSAIRNGAVDFFQKPFRGNELVMELKEAINSYKRPMQSAGKDAPYLPGREPLTRRERDVLHQLVMGASNKDASRTLGISPRTIEDHRNSIMRKLGAKNVADLVRIAMTEVLPVK